MSFILTVIDKYVNFFPLIVSFLFGLKNSLFYVFFGDSEYAYTYKVNEKSDVYSFGVVLMELVTGKRPVEPEFGESKDIVHWVYNKVKSQDNALDLVDPAISNALREDAVKVLRIAIRCTSQAPGLRPSMRMVVHMLEEAEPCKLTDISVVKEAEK